MTATTKTTNVVVLAAELADEFRPGAAELDKTGKFASSNYARMREAGYMRAAVPSELGGLGAGLLETAKAQQALARGDASTALAINMHHFQVGGAADAWRGGGATEGLLRRIVKEGIVLGSTAAEAIVAGEWSTPTTATPEGDGYRINGRKYFASQSSGMDVCRVNAMGPDPSEILVFSIPMNAEGVRIEETWDTMGMRATASHDLIFENVFVPESALGARQPSSNPISAPGFANVAAWFLSLMSSVYLGIAEEARAEVHNALGKGMNSSFRTGSLTDVMLGELEVSYATALCARDRIVGEIDGERSDPLRAFSLALTAKEIIVPHAVATVDKAVQIAGGKSFFKRSPLERLARDVRAGAFHPPAAPISHQMIGQRVQDGLSLG